MDDFRVTDYFVVAGLDPDQQLPLEEFSNEAITKPSFRLDPITDIAVINRSLGEKVPAGYECIEVTPSGFPANLNHGSLRCPDMFICYKRGRDKPPLRDLGILYEGKERVMEGCEVVHSTAKGNPANINNSSNNRIFVTYRRAEQSAASDTLVVVDICVILGSRGEEPPLTFLKIGKNLNKGMIGSDVYLCYKKAMVKNDVLAYKAAILDRYPREDYEEFPLPESVPMFCLPMGATIECWSADAQHPLPSFSTFILTGSAGEKVYGAAVGFYEEFREEDLTDLQMRSLGLKNKVIREQYRIQKTVHVRKSISLLSHWPFFDAFKKFLSHLYKISITGPHNVPIERHISHFMFDVPYPSPERPRIMVGLSMESLWLCMPENSPFPQSGASFITLLRNLGPELTMNLLLFVLVESKILLHSLRPTVLTEVAEAVSTMIFPFQWQCPYIPLCPLGLSEILNAPFPFIVGVDSRYFDLFDPPSDVICVDLDTNRIYLPDDKKSMNYKLLPKKPTRVMQESLSRLYHQVSLLRDQKLVTEEVSLETAHHDAEFRRKKQNMQIELTIQEVFLRFTACILKDYRNFLNPITTRATSKATGAASLFDMQGFIKNQEKVNAKFYSQMMQTQMFFRFIEERSFVSDKDDSLAFFDECSEKVDEMSDEPKLIEIENSERSERTVFIMPPEPVNLPEGIKYHYNGFPALKWDLFLEKQKPIAKTPTKQICPNSPLTKRSKQEVKTAQKIALQQAEHPENWPKCLLSYCYSLWFVAFPAYVQSQPKKYEALKVGLAVLQKMQRENLKNVDELCYRVLMQLAGQYNKPGLAVQVFSQMKMNGIHPNASTYGYYNKVMLEAKWPSAQSKAHLRWMKIRNIIIAVAQFRKKPNHRGSIYSNSGSELDKISHASEDSCMFESQASTATTNNTNCSAGTNAVVLIQSKDATCDKSCPLSASEMFDTSTSLEGSETILSKKNGNLEERMSTGGASDRGYNSLTQEDVKRMSQIMSSAADDGNGNSHSPTINYSFDKAKLSCEAREKQAQVIHKRGGSIVKRVNSVRKTHALDFDVLKESLLCNSCGLVILSQAYLMHSTTLPARDLCKKVVKVKRRRHLSSGEVHNKRMRSFSLFPNWGTTRQKGWERKSNSVDVPETLATVKERPGSIFSKNGGGVSITEEPSLCIQQPIDSTNEILSSSSSSAFSAQDQTLHEFNSNNSHSSHCMPEPSAVGASNVPLVTIDESDLSSQDQANNAETCTDDTTPLSSDGASTGSPQNIPSHDSHRDNTKCSEQPKTVCNDTEPTSGTEVKANSGQLKVTSPRTPSLAETGRTLSSPGDDGSMEAKAARRKLSEDVQSISSLNSEPRWNKPADFLMKRSQSLKKTNEALIGSFLKAGKAAFNKLSELSQTIAIKSSSLGSQGSLTHSVEELDYDGSSNSGTIRDRFKYGGSQDLLSHSEESEEDGYSKLSTSLEGASSLSYLDDISCLKSSADAEIGLSENSDCDKIKVAMEVEMSTLSRCTKCNHLIYDEEIMAGWSAEDSNLNTRCPYCHNKFVPSLQVYLKDNREDSSATVFNPRQSFPVQEKLLATSVDETQNIETLMESHLNESHSADQQTCKPTLVDLSPTAHHPLAPDPQPESSSGQGEEEGLEGGSRPSETSEPFVMPYLSPLVLRKEVEYVLDHEGNTSLSSDSFVEDHPIIFWNMIWFFRRIEVPSHLVNFLLTSKAFFCNKSQNVEKYKGMYTNRNILIRPQWDNIRIHDEGGQPLYISWRARNSSSVVDALTIDNSFKMMSDIKKSIEKNDVGTAIKHIQEYRRGVNSRQHRFRSMYREILFLSFAACGRHNIDHDAFDRVYLEVFDQQLHPVEIRRLQRDDHPKGYNVQCCRRAFCELEL